MRRYWHGILAGLLLGSALSLATPSAQIGGGGGGINGGGGGGTGTPASPVNAIQFNNAGAFGGSANLTWNGTALKATNLTAPLGVPTGVAFDSVDALGSLPAGTYYLVLVGVDADGNTTTKSNEISGTITAPNDGVGEINFTWDRVGLNDDNYRIYYGATPGGQAHYVAMDSDADFGYFYDLSGAVVGTPPVTNTALSVNLPTSITAAVNFQNFLWPDPVWLGQALGLDSRNYHESLIVSNSNAIGGAVHVAAQISAHQEAVNSSVFAINGNAVGHVNSSILVANTGYVAVLNGSTVDEGETFHAYAPDVDGTLTKFTSYWTGALGGRATNAYSFWQDEQGVFQIKADNTFNSVYQAISALYNPQVTKYTAGAANYERCIPGCQWNSNIAEIGTEAGGTGTLRALKFIGTLVTAPTIVTSGTAPSVANVGANSCGTTAATLAGNNNAGEITVGATAGTQCRVTFTIAAPTRRVCIPTDATTTIATRATYVDTTHSDFFGAFVAGDVVSYTCFAN